DATDVAARGRRGGEVRGVGQPRLDDVLAVEADPVAGGPTQGDAVDGHGRAGVDCRRPDDVGGDLNGALPGCPGGAGGSQAAGHEVADAARQDAEVDDGAIRRHVGSAAAVVEHDRRGDVLDVADLVRRVLEGEGDEGVDVGLARVRAVTREPVTGGTGQQDAVDRDAGGGVDGDCARSRRVDGHRAGAQGTRGAGVDPAAEGGGGSVAVGQAEGHQRAAGRLQPRAAAVVGLDRGRDDVVLADLVGGGQRADLDLGVDVSL